MAIEFYPVDWASWTLKYANTGEFFVRNRVSGREENENGSTSVPGGSVSGDDPNALGRDNENEGSGGGCTVAQDTPTTPCWYWLGLSAAAFLRHCRRGHGQREEFAA